MSDRRPRTATPPKAVCEPATETACLPHGFRRATLGELFAKRTEPGRSGLPIMSLTMDRGLVQRDSVDRRVETNLTPEHHLLILKGDLVYNTMRMWQGVSGLAEFDGLLSPAYVVLRSLGEIAPEYAAHLFKDAATIAEFRHFAYGVVDDRLRLYFRDLRRIPVAIPQSLLAQRKIAKILTTVDNLIEKTEALIAKYQSVKQGLMHDLFTRGVDEHGHLRPPYAEAPDLYNKSELGWIPREWEVRPLGQLSEVGGGVTLGRDLAGSQVAELPYLRVANVQDGFLDLSEIKTVAVLKSEVPRFLLQPGDMLMTEGGDFDKLGRGTVWRGQISPCLHQNHIFRVRPNTALIAPDFLASVTASNYGKRYFLVSSKQTTNLATINSTQLKAFPVPLPVVEEQSRIISPLRAFEHRLRNEQVYLAKLRTTKTALMQDLLTGKVRVKVDTEATHA